MTAHTTQSAHTARLIHVHQIAERAREALVRTRSAAWQNGLNANAGGAEFDTESRNAAEVTTAISELVALALGVEDRS